MEKNPKLAKNHRDNSFTKEKARKKWEELANSPNSLGGSQKTVKQWKRIWTDLKMICKKKAASIRRHTNKTGGGTVSSSDDEDEDLFTLKFESELAKQLSDTQSAPGPATLPAPVETAAGTSTGSGSTTHLQGRILSLLGDTVVDGIKGVRELGLDQFRSDSEEEMLDEPHHRKRPKVVQDLNTLSKKKKITSKSELTAEWLKNTQKKIEATEKVAEALNNIAAQIGRIADCFEVYNNATM